MKKFRVHMLAVFIPLICCSYRLTAQPEARTLETFGVQVKHGQPVYPLPSNVTRGLFNPDPWLDLAYYADGKIQVWQNLGDGTFGSEPVYEKRVSGNVAKMTFKKSHMWTETIFDKDSWGDLYLTYANGTIEKTSHEWMMGASRNFSSLPQMTGSFPPLNFTEKWRSEGNPRPTRDVEISDIDNDGRMELMYSIGDSVSIYDRLTVFENYGNNLYRKEWDSLMESGAPLCVTDVDKDGHKEIVVAYTIPGSGAIGLLENFGGGQFRFYRSNIGFDRPPFRVLQTDVDHDGINELTVLTSDPNAIQDRTLIYIAKYTGKSIGSNGWLMSFNGQIARYQGYAFDMAVGQVDGTGRDEIIPAGGSFGFHESVPVDYLWYSGIPGPQLWRRREIYTGLQSGTGTVMFANLDADTMKEFVSGAPGPIGHGSLFALKYLHDTTWSVMWADSSLRNAPLWVNTGVLSSISVVGGANTYAPNADTSQTWLHVYRNGGEKLGTWFRDSASFQQFHFINLDNDNYTDLAIAYLSLRSPHYLKVFETDQPNSVTDEESLSLTFSLKQNYPNPFNPSTRIRFIAQQSGTIDLRIYDILGKEVKTLVNKHLQEGAHNVEWNGTNNEGGDVGSGVYLYRIIITNTKGATYTATRKMILIR